MMLVGYQGAPGAFGEAAALGLWPNAEPVGLTTFEAVVAGVRSGRLDAGVLPVENLIVGPVRAAIDALTEASDLDHSREITVPVALHLLGTGDASVGRLLAVLGHPVALAQCRGFLGSLPDVAITEWYDSAGAARAVSRRNDRSVGVIASRSAAERYGLRVLVADVHDRPGNATRFVGLERRR